MKNFIRKHLYLILAILWAGAIFVGSSIPGPTLPSAPDATSTVAHIAEYTILGVLLMQMFGHYKKRFMVVDTVVLGIVYAISDEIHQYFVPGRHTDPVDLLLDAIGLTLGILIFMFMHRKHPIRKT